LSVYVDASFLVSAYAADGNFEAAVQAMESSSRDPFVLTVFCELEVVNALELRLFRKEMTRQQLDLCLSNFDADVRGGILRLHAMPESVFHRARQLSLQTTANLGNRAGDILHVAAALELGAEGFYSFDERQRNLARSMRLRLND
jgi:predicted nucleic acid-binding protein